MELDFDKNNAFIRKHSYTSPYALVLLLSQRS